jgi:hypothetical protein
VNRAGALVAVVVLVVGVGHRAEGATAARDSK